MISHKLVFILVICLAFVCGSKKGNGKKKHHRDVGIIGGHHVTIEQVPYMVSVRLNGTYHWCGGSIIHEQFVLTAAHCIVPNRQYKVLVGTDNVDQGGEIYDVEKIITHELYSRKTDDYDICVIKLAKTLTFGAKVAKIQLADKNVSIKKGTLLQIAGWGNTKPNGTISTELQQVSIPAISTRMCRRAYFSILHDITPRMMCAGGSGKDSCQGDSGGPLTLDGAQVGIASFGAGCGTIAGVYTKVSTLLSWIENTLTSNL